MKSSSALATALLIGALLAPGLCRGGEIEDPDIQEIHVLATEMSFQVKGQAPGKPISLKAGEVYRIFIENTGKMKHEILMGRSVIENAGTPTGYRELLLRDQDVNITGVQKVGKTERKFEVESRGLRELEMDPGTRLGMMFTLPETSRGDWELGCFMPGHYKSGMHLAIQVR